MFGILGSNQNLRSPLSSALRCEPAVERPERVKDASSRKMLHVELSIEAFTEHSL